MEELELKELLEIFWNKKVHIILTTCIFILLGIVYTLGFVTPEYEASTTLVLVTASNSTSSEENLLTDTTTVTTTDITLNSQLVTTYSELIKSNKVVREVISNLNINIDENNLKESITVTSVDDTELIKISVVNEDSEVASDIANEIAEVFTVTVEEIYNIDNVHIVDMAETSDSPVNINHIRDIMLFAFIGMFLAAGIVFIVNMLDTTIKTQEEIEKKLGIQVISMIPLYDTDMAKKGRR